MENSDSVINRDVHNSAKEENHLIFIYHKECKKITCVCGMVIEGPHTCLIMSDMLKSGQAVRVICQVCDYTGCKDENGKVFYYHGLNSKGLSAIRDCQQ